MDKLYIILPAYNEEENIDSVAREWHDVAVRTGTDSRLVIIDDGSSDGTYDRLCRLKTELSQLECVTKPNGGHGATVHYGYRYALEHSADYVFQTDSDGQTLPSEFDAFWENRMEFDIQIGARKSRGDGLSRVIISKILKLVLLLQFGLRIQDANTPYRLMSAVSLSEVFPHIPDGHALTNVLLTVLYYKHKKRIMFRPITFRPRQGGVNSINLAKIVKIGLTAMRDFASLRKAV